MPTQPSNGEPPPERTRRPAPARGGEGGPNPWITLLLLLGVAALVVLPLAIGSGNDLEEPFEGADALAEETVEDVAPQYEPWFEPIYEAPSTEIESGLFALQAAIGAGIIGYYFGVVRTRARIRRELPYPPSGGDAADVTAAESGTERESRDGRT